MWSFWKCVYALAHPASHFFLLSSLAAANPDVYTGSSALAPACRVPGVLSAVRDVWQQTGMAWPAGRAVLDGSAVSIVDRQPCGSDLCVTGCQSHQRATNQHSPSVIPPDYRQGKLWILNMAHRLLCLLPCCCTIHSLWLQIQLTSLSVTCIGVTIECWWKGDSVQVVLPVSPLENVCLQGRYSEIDKSYKRIRDTPVKWNDCHFITRDISAVRDPLPQWECLLECVCLPLTTLPTHSPCPCVTGDI